MRALLTVLLLALVALLIHEGGHALVARLCGARIRGFTLGFGPLLKRYHLGLVAVDLRALPLGGMVDVDVDGLRHPMAAKLASVAGGPMANLVAAVCLAAAALQAGIPARVDCPAPGACAPPPALTAWSVVGNWSTEAILSFGHRPMRVLPPGHLPRPPHSTAEVCGVLLLVLALLNLGTFVFNALPLPGLDGGALLGAAMGAAGLTAPGWAASAAEQLAPPLLAALLLAGFLGA